MKLKKAVLIKFRIKNFVVALLTVLAIILLLVHSDDAAAGGVEGLITCADIIIPSLFPFIVIAIFLNKSRISHYAGRLLEPVTRLLFRLPGAAGNAIFLSYLAGYPIGARLTRELYRGGKISRSQAVTMLYFTVNAGPAFIFSAVGVGMLRSGTAGIILLSANTAASLLMGIIIGHLNRGSLPSEREKEKPKPAPGFAEAFVESTADAASSVLGICGWVIFFSAVMHIFYAMQLPDPIAVLMAPVTEVTNGCIRMAPVGNLPLMSAVLGWGGLSVHCQVLSSAGEIHPPIGKFFLARAAHAGLSALVAFLILQCYPSAVPAISNQVPVQAAGGSVSLTASVALLCMSVVLLFSLCGEHNLDQSELRLWSRFWR